MSETAVDGHRLQLGLVGILLAFLIVSCGSAGRTANADETTNPPTTPSSAAQVVMLVDLDEASEVATWTTVNDPVMGGQSTSRITFGDGGLVFSGSVSLENNGGFASARSPQDPDIGRRATGAKSLRVRALGDGKTYVLKVGTAGQPGPTSSASPPRPPSSGSTNSPLTASSPLASASIPHSTRRRLWTRRTSTRFRSTSSTNSRAPSNSPSARSTRRPED